MTRTAGGTFFGALRVERSSIPLFRQLYRTVRGAILDGTLEPGTRLPSTRTLARDLAISRTTAEEAFAQLEAEGFVERRVGAGTHVAAIDTAVAPRRRPRPESPVAPPRLSTRGGTLARHACFPSPAEPRPFSTANPAVDAFPFETWRAIVGRCLRHSGERTLGTGDPAGYRPLREAIARYLATSRGVVGSPDQVIVMTSSQQALDLAAGLLLDPGEAVWLEEPGYPGARAALLAHGARIVPVPVDEEGLAVAVGVERARNARLAYVTPSHQYPLGATLSLERRLALLDWARRQGAWILEDDYDSEFRYDGRPLAAMQGIDEDARVIYVGTFTKSLFPALRLAYAVVPEDLVEPFVTARGLIDGFPPTLTQMAVTELIADGHFGVHLRRMRELYRQRRDALVEAVGRWLNESIRLGPVDSGLHAVAHLPLGSDDRAFADRALRQGVEVQPLSCYYHGAPPQSGLFLGYGAFTPTEIERGIRMLANSL